MTKYMVSIYLQSSGYIHPQTYPEKFLRSENKKGKIKLCISMYSKKDNSSSYISLI